MFTFSLGDLDEEEQQTATEYPYRDWEEAYRGKWKWDSKVRGSHTVDCYPTVGACPYWVYIKDGQILFQEQAGTLPGIEGGVPDFNPMGCQKGACWHIFNDQEQSRERILYPMKRIGERGSGQWQRISWDQAFTEIADGILDALQEAGPESIYSVGGPNANAWGHSSMTRFLTLIGGIEGDFEDVGDFVPGMAITWGKFVVSSEDDRTHADLIFIVNMNPNYTRIPYAHFLYEARYKGAELVLIAPDYSPSAMHTDYHVPVKVGTDAALWLGMCKVIVDEGLVDTAFVKDQTDLPLLVRLDNRRFLRASDVEEDGFDEQFYFYDSKTSKVVEAPRETLNLGDIEPALEGTYTVALKDGRTVEVAPVFQLLQERLSDYTPEKASAMCGVNPDVIRTLARKAASGRTSAYEGLGGGKHYHADLMQRSMYLMLALTGNWGRKGAGPTVWGPGPNAAGDPKMLRSALDAIKAQDPTMTDEIAAVKMAQRAAGPGRTMIPIVFWWYHHVNFRELWNKRQYHDPSMTREFDEYWKEAIDKGWWQSVAYPRGHVPPLVLLEVGGNMLRRSRGGQPIFLKNLWPKLKLIVDVDVRMSTTALFSDYVLPAAQQHERISTGGGNGVHSPFRLLHEKAVEPAGEAMSEFQMFRLLCRKMEELAKARGFVEYPDPYYGHTRRLDNLESAWTANGAMAREEDIVAANIRNNAAAGVVPADTTIETMRENVAVQITGMGLAPFGLNVATDIKTDETITALTNHVEKKQVYPTLVRRAQFYIDHEWFLEAGEELPVHKDVPKMGGDFPLMITSGHNRWSIHATNIANKLMLNTHRGHPHLIMNPDDAARRGLRDDEEVRVHNDMGEFTVRVKLSPGVQPGQVVCYSGWDPYQFRNWHGPNDIEGAMIKWLGLAGGYGHLVYWPLVWQPWHSDRGTRVEVSKID